MPNLKDTLSNDMKSAMRSGDRVRRDTLRLILSSIKQSEVDLQISLDDDGLQAVLEKEAKMRRESISDYERAGQPEVAASQAAELAIIQEYLPAQATEEEITVRAQAIIQEQNVTSSKQMGLVMKQLMTEFKGRADGRLVSQIVRGLL